MADQEHKETIKIIVGIITLIIVIGLTIGLVVWAVGESNDKTDDLKASLASTELREFDIYNGTAVKGSSVITAIKQYQGRGLTIIVDNKSTKLGDKSGISTPDKGNSCTSYLVPLDSIDYDSDKGMYTATAGDEEEITNLQNAQKRGNAAYIPSAANYTSTLLMSEDFSEVLGIVFDKIA